MRIDLIEFVPVTLPRKETFTIARGSSDVAENVFVAVHSGNLVGHGNAAESEVTHENLYSVRNASQTFARALSGFEFDRPSKVAERMGTVISGNPSAKAAVDMAVHDLAAQEEGVPLYAYLGVRRDRMPTDMTIGIMDKEAAVARAHPCSGHRTMGRQCAYRAPPLGAKGRGSRTVPEHSPSISRLRV